MFTLPPSVRIFLCNEPADLRRQLDGPAALTREPLRREPLSGHLFVFANRRRNRVKILFWNRNDPALYYKRLEKGRFHFPRGNAKSVEVEAADRMLLLEGIDPAGAKRRPGFVPAGTK